MSNIIKLNLAHLTGQTFVELAANLVNVMSMGEIREAITSQHVDLHLLTARTLAAIAGDIMDMEGETARFRAVLDELIVNVGPFLAYRMVGEQRA